MDGSLFWSFVLLGIGLLLLVLEFFIPSGGVLAIACCLSLLASVVVAFSVSMGWGMSMVVVVAVVVPIALAATIRLWPRTPIGRSIMARQPGDPLPDLLPDDDYHRKIKALQGRVGVAINDLLPNGMIRIDGEKFDAVSVGGAIDHGQTIEVIRIEAGKLHVRATTRPISEPATSPITETSPLDQPIDQLGIDSLDDPLA